MALTRVNIPTATAPVAVTDYQAQNDQLTAMVQAYTGRNPVDGSTIHAGTVLMVGNVLYKSDTDTTISGTASNYVKITPSGATATAAFASSLSGVSWNHVYGQYLDGSGNLYLFDEARAINSGVISTAYTMQGQIAYTKGALDINGALTGVTSLGMGGALTGATNITASGTVTATNYGVVNGTSAAFSGNVSANGKNCPPIPTSVSGLGQFVQIYANVSTALVLPAGGNWAFFFILVSATGYSAVIGAGAGVSPGGTQIASESALYSSIGFAWRVS